MTPVLLAAALWALAGPQQATVPSGPDLAAARALYAAGNYEDALRRLSATPGDATLGEVDEYRALCLLALGRSTDAQHSLEDLVTRQPLFKMSDTELSPRLVTMFRDTRKRLLPRLARDLYAKAKADYEQEQYVTSSAEFKDLLALLGDEDLADTASTVADLKMLAEGFSKLADANAAEAAKAAAVEAARVAAAKAAATPPPPTTPPDASPTAPAPASTPDAGAKIYTESDTDVVPPVAISAPYPIWRPPSSKFNQDYHGLLRIVIDAAGHVESATMVVSVHVAYDPLLVTAAKDWTFKPATRNGQNVKYRRLIAVSLSPH
jgi:tetratricopeptide (TPR) repeat protein